MMQVFLNEPVNADSVSVSLAPYSEPTAAPTASIPTSAFFVECVPPPMPPGMTPGPETRPSVLDETGLLGTCAQTDVVVRGSGPISVDKPFVDNELVVMWDTNVCSQFTFRRTANSYELAARSAADDCPTGFGGPITLRFTVPMPADELLVTLDGLPLGAGPTPTPIDQVTPHTMECVGDGRATTFIDQTGLVVSCTNLPGVDEHFSESVTIPNGDPGVLRIVWRTSSCSDHAAARLAYQTLDPTSTNVPATLVFTVSNETTTVGCDLAHPSGRGVELTFRQPIDPASVIVSPPT
jgi:hypothetical protein